MTLHTKPEAAGEALPEWRLDDLFSGRDDPHIELELAEAVRANGALLNLKGAFVGARADPERLGRLLAEAIGLYELATNKLWAVGAYASLATSVARDDPAWAKFEADIRERSSFRVSRPPRPGILRSSMMASAVPPPTSRSIACSPVSAWATARPSRSSTA